MAEGEFPQLIVAEREHYIARTSGKRAFPWRVFIIGDDRLLPATDLVYRLAEAPVKSADWSWVKPGQGTDEWIINIALFNVPFKAGINTETYLYYIDFAKKFGLERIMMDAGWSDVKDLFKINPDLDMDRIAAYAKEKGIGLSMWTLAHTLNRQLEPALEQFRKWGVDFIMTDFIDRDDQPMVNFHHRIAEACARRKIMVMFHGSFKPAGFERTWPNAVTREGVLGSEYNAWSEKATPGNNVLTAFIRMTSGPLDYEPGLLDNATRFTFRPLWGKVMSQGTRCHQLAMFAVYDSHIQIFSGNPSTGMQEPLFMELLGSIPASWEETQVPAAELGEYVVSTRRHGDQWFMAGLNNWNPRQLDLSLDFLPPGKTYEATICADGLNADKYAADYRLTQKAVQHGDIIKLDMASGGGFLVRFDPR
jgi:alpha-glucosidase